MCNRDVTKHPRAAASIRWQGALPAVAAAAIQIGIALSGAIACECAPPPPPCEEYPDTQMVFLGTVTEALRTRGSTISLARMRIDHAYKGVSEKTLILFDDGMCDGPYLKVGEQYVMYTHRIGDGPVPSRGCTRSANVKDAAEDLKYLNGLATAAPLGTVFGQVSIHADGVGDRDRPAAGAVVRIQGAGSVLTAAADSQGHYSFEGLKPARYSVTASQPGFSVLEFLSNEDDGPMVTLRARACVGMDMTLRRDWPGTIQGRLTRSDGARAPAGIFLTLIRVEGTGSNEKSQVVLNERARTDDQGEYSFRQAAPGRYKVAINWLSAPTPDVPYPTTYWPAASTEKAASEVEIGDGAVSQRCDFRLPPELKSTLVTGTVLLPDGKPAKGARVDVTVLPDPSGSHFAQGVSSNLVDAAGHFSFTAMERVDYSVTAAKTGVGWANSQPLRFPPGSGPKSIALTLAAAPAR